MAVIFIWCLAIATFVTGVIWCLERFKFAPARRAKIVKLQAQKEQSVDPKTLTRIGQEQAPAPGWVENLASLFPVLAFVFILRSFVVEPFQIPSGSMMPTLLIGDFILVQKYAYGLKNPLTNTTLIKTGEPKRGDVVVFKYPLSPNVDYIKRMIGLPGDKIVYNPISKELTIYPHCDRALVCKEQLAINYTPPQSSPFISLEQTATQKGGLFESPIADTVTNGVRLQEVTETLGNVSHHILVDPSSWPQSLYIEPGFETNVFEVPAGHYFVMGDNRDYSADSRFWGFVPEKDLVGKAFFIWMSFKKNEGEWPTGVRLNRIGFIK